MIRHALAAATLSLFACHACNEGNAPTPASPTATAGSATTAPGAADVVVHVEDDGKTFDVARGAPIAFKLASNAGTGYEWTPTQIDANVLAQQGGRTSEVASEVPGAPKMDVYRFIGSSAGTTAVEMTLKRPFGSAPAARAIHVTVNVR